jgi:tetratricopeptide (TPR) repeat protein
MNSKNDSRLKKAYSQLQRAKLLRKQQKLQEAVLLCEALLNEFPNYASASLTAAVILMEQGNYPAALANLIRAEIADPDNPETLFALSEAYSQLGSRRKAIQALERAREISPHDSNLIRRLGKLLLDHGELQQACIILREADKLNPADVSSACNLARCYINLGELDRAARLAETLIENGARSTEVIEIAGQLPPGSLGNQTLTKAFERLPEKSQADLVSTELALAFAKAQLLDKLARHEEAWQAFVDANSRIFSVLAVRYRIQLQLRKRSLADLKELKPISAQVKANEATPLFIIGASRSGKTVLEKLLGSIPGVTKGFENLDHYVVLSRCLHRAGYPPLSDDFDSLPKELDGSFRHLYADYLRKRLGNAQVMTNTHPGLIEDASSLGRLLPSARFIFVTRNRIDHAFRIFGSVYREGHSYAYNLGTISEYLSWYNEMVNLAHTKLPSRSLVVEYEDIVANPFSVAKEICPFLGLNLSSPVGLPEIGDDRDCSAPYQEFMHL